MFRLYKPVFRYVLPVMIIFTVFAAMLPTELSAVYGASKTPARVYGLKAVTKGRRISLTWKKARDAYRYRVYVKKGNASWTVLKKSVKSRKVLYYAPGNATYRFRVRSINKKGKLSRKYSDTAKAIITCIEKAQTAEDSAIQEDPAIQIVGDSEITVNELEEFTLTVIGKDVDEDVYWKYSDFFTMSEKHEKGKSTVCLMPCAGSVGDTTITVITGAPAGEEQSVTYTVHVMPFVDRSPTKTIDGITFKGIYDERIRINSSREIYTDKELDPDKIRVVADFPDGVYYKETNFYGSNHTNKWVSDNNIGVILLKIKNNAVETGKTYPAIINFDVLSYIPLSGKSVTINVDIYYDGELLQRGYSSFDPDRGSYSYQEWISRIWKDNMTPKEKLEALCKYIADNYTYDEMDCRGADNIAFAAKFELGLISWMQYQETVPERTYNPLSTYPLPAFAGACHRVAVVVIDGEQWAFHAQGGGYYVSRIDQETMTDSLRTHFTPVEYSTEPL
ncbi:MAG: hypothetical protein IJH41_03630 [Eubacterium sp.]|nr:hypothetical protein [Eubacterium sp.]